MAVADRSYDRLQPVGSLRSRDGPYAAARARAPANCKSTRSEHNDFVANVAHSGDAAPDYDIEAPRFDHHGRTWASWTHTAFMRQAVACATAVATFGGATYAAKCEMRDLHSAASHHQVGELAEDAEPLEPMPEPMCSA